MPSRHGSTEPRVERRWTLRSNRPWWCARRAPTSCRRLDCAVRSGCSGAPVVAETSVLDTQVADALGRRPCCSTPLRCVDCVPGGGRGRGPGGQVVDLAGKVGRVGGSRRRLSRKPGRPASRRGWPRRIGTFPPSAQRGPNADATTVPSPTPLPCLRRPVDGSGQRARACDHGHDRDDARRSAGIPSRRRGEDPFVGPRPPRRTTRAAVLGAAAAVLPGVPVPDLSGRRSGSRQIDLGPIALTCSGRSCPRGPR
jgi:hypothetical protein